MNLSQSKKAINERRRRLNDREKRRHNVFVHDYICTKYREIYNECNIFYQELRKQYPKKLNLIKTYQYKKWKRQLTTGEADMSEPVHPEPAMIETETVQAIHTEPAMIETETVQAIHPQPAMIETETVQAIHPEPAMIETETVQAIHSEADISESASSILEQASQGLFPSSSLSAEDVQELSIEDMDRIVQEIISELEQDQGVRDLLPYVQSDVEEDEGIELNIETELGAIVEPFDHELDMEGAEW